MVTNGEFESNGLSLWVDGARVEGFGSETEEPLVKVREGIEYCAKIESLWRAPDRSVSAHPVMSIGGRLRDAETIDGEYGFVGDVCDCLVRRDKSSMRYSVEDKLPRNTVFGRNLMLSHWKLDEAYGGVVYNSDKNGTWCYGDVFTSKTVFQGIFSGLTAQWMLL